MGWQLVLFESARGDKYVQKFVLSLDAKLQGKISRKFDLLEEYGDQLTGPHCKHIINGLYELRVTGRVHIRVLYKISGGSIILLHAFKKKTDQLPVKEIKTALDRWKLYNS